MLREYLHLPGPAAHLEAEDSAPAQQARFLARPAREGVNLSNSSRSRHLAHFRIIMPIVIKDLGHLNGFRP